MNDLLFVFGVLTTIIVLFAIDRIRVDVVAVMALLALTFVGILTPREALAGFSDATVIMIAGLFVVGAGLFQTGVAGALGNALQPLARNDPQRLTILIMVLVALLSAFMSSTGTVALLLPVATGMAASMKLGAGRILIPLAYSASLGGMITLIGTPPNIVISEQLRLAGREPFSFFSFTPIGLTMLGIGILYMMSIGRRLLPEPAPPDAGKPSARPSLSYLSAEYGLLSTSALLRVLPDSQLSGSTPGDHQIGRRFGVDLLAVQRTNGTVELVRAATTLQAGELILVRGDPERLRDMENTFGLERLPLRLERGQIERSNLAVAEVVPLPRASLLGQTLNDSAFRETYRVSVIGIIRQSQPINGEFARVELRFGDTLLVLGEPAQIELLRRNIDDFAVIGGPPTTKPIRSLAPQAPIAIAIMLGMLVLMTFELVPNAIAVVLAAMLMVVSGCVSGENVYRSINWESIVLVAAMLPVATALEKTGGITLLANLLVQSVGSMGALPLMAGIFLLTSLLSQFISNTATAVLIAPVAIQAALGAGVAPEPILMTVVVAVSASFATPIASPVNTLVMAPGNYRFADFARIGLPLQLLILVATLIVVPLLFPFQ